MGERRVRNAKVEGSNPFVSSCRKLVFRMKLRMNASAAVMRLQPGDPGGVDLQDAEITVVCNGALQFDRIGDERKDSVVECVSLRIGQEISRCVFRQRRS